MNIISTIQRPRFNVRGDWPLEPILRHWQVASIRCKVGNLLLRGDCLGSDPNLGGV